MREFFKGWRRKTGCVMLVMTCVLAAGWVRSEFVRDRLKRNYTGGAVGLFSTSGQIGFGRREYGIEFRAPEPFISFDSTPITKRYPFAGFHIVKEFEKAGGGVETYAVPYYFIVIPLVVLTAFLLLSRHRSSHQKTTPELISPMLE